LDAPGESNTLRLMERVLVINGPNLNLLGTREPAVYGSITLPRLEAMVEAWGGDLDVAVATFQSNHEGAIIDRLHAASGEVDGVILNAGAYTHTSYAIHDAILATGLPTVEVHISNIHAREPWRRISLTAPACVRVIFGRGLAGYRDALRHLWWRDAWPATTVHYGSGTCHEADLRVPDGSGPFPVAALFHGGAWRDPWTRDLMDGLAVDLARRGWATWNIEYHRVCAGGGWPSTMTDTAAALDALDGLAAAHRLDLSRVVTVGHEAGGQLALWAGSRPSLTSHGKTPAPAVAIGAAVALAPLADLAAAHREGVAGDAIEQYLRRTPEDGADRFALASPAALLPLGIPQVVVHGAADERVPVTLSRHYAGAAAQAGDPVVYHEIEGAGHDDLIDPASEAWQVVAGELDGLR
jgi:3-dehydroquinate dehydratase type II